MLFTSKGAAGVTGGAFAALAATVVAAGLPAEGLALLLGIDRFMSLARAITNTIGNAVAAIVVAQMGRRIRSRRPGLSPPRNSSKRSKDPRLKYELPARMNCPSSRSMPGDCTGIGPEQTARILADGRLADVARLVVVGDARVLEMGMAHAGVKLEGRARSPRRTRPTGAAARCSWSISATPIPAYSRSARPARNPAG